MLEKFVRRAPARAASLIEGLESRRLLSAAVPHAEPVPPATATITGNVFNDLNADGVRQSGEAGLAGVSIHLTPIDAPNVAGRDVVTNSAGHYTFADVAPGRYHITETLPAGATETRPTTPYAVAVTGGQTVNDENFGQHTQPAVATGAISGIVFNDANDNGLRDTGEAGLPGVTVTLGHEGAARSVVTNASGEYVFSDLPVGGYEVHEVVLAGAVQTTPADQKGYNVTLTAGQRVTDERFGQYKAPPPPANGSISGIVFNDTNANGSLDGSESPSGVRTVFIDANGNNTLDSGEVSVQSDASGKYTFTNVAPGVYHVERVLPAGYRLTNNANGYVEVHVASGQAVTGVNLGSAANETPPKVGSITGVLFNDDDGDGVFDANESASGVRTVYIDANGNGKLDSGEKSTQSSSTGVYKFDGLTADHYKISRVFPDGYHLTGTAATYLTITVAAGQNVTGVNLGSAKNK